MARATLHSRVAENILAEIRAGTWTVGSDLPSESALCEQFGVSRHTVRHALRSLQEGGHIFRKQGATTKVLSRYQPKRYIQSFNSLREIYSYPRNTFRQNVSEEFVECDHELQPLLKAPLGSAWYRIGAIRKEEQSNLLLAWTDIYILQRFAALTKLPEHSHAMVYEQIEQHYGVSIERAEVDIYASSISAEHAARLLVEPGSPCLVVVRRYFDKADQTFEVTITRHPESRYVYSMQLRSNAEKQ